MIDSLYQNYQTIFKNNPELEKSLIKVLQKEIKGFWRLELKIYKQNVIKLNETIKKNLKAKTDYEASSSKKIKTIQDRKLKEAFRKEKKDNLDKYDQIIAECEEDLKREKIMIEKIEQCLKPEMVKEWEKIEKIEKLTKTFEVQKKTFEEELAKLQEK